MHLKLGRRRLGSGTGQGKGYLRGEKAWDPGFSFEASQQMVEILFFSEVGC